MEATTQLTDAQRTVLKSLDLLEDAKASYASAIGVEPSKVTVRTDLYGGEGMVLIFDNTATYGLEARSVARGVSVFRVNLDMYNSASAIPDTYRKAKRIAKAVERHSVSDLIAAQKQYEADYRVFRAL